MKFVFGIFSLIVISIEARGTPKIEIFEIHETDNGLTLKNFNSNPKNHQKSDSLIKLLREPKPDNEATRFAKQLLGKLKSIKGEEKSVTHTRLNDDAHIYIINNDILDDDSSYEESIFIDKTRNDRASNDRKEKDLRDILMQLVPLRKKKSRMSRHPPVLRTDDTAGDDRAVAPRHIKREYAYDDSSW